MLDGLWSIVTAHVKDMVVKGLGSNVIAFTTKVEYVLDFNSSQCALSLFFSVPSFSIFLFWCFFFFFIILFIFLIQKCLLY